MSENDSRQTQFQPYVSFKGRFWQRRRGLLNARFKILGDTGPCISASDASPRSDFKLQRSLLWDSRAIYERSFERPALVRSYPPVLLLNGNSMGCHNPQLFPFAPNIGFMGAQELREHLTMRKFTYDGGSKLDNTLPCMRRDSLETSVWKNNRRHIW